MRIMITNDDGIRAEGLRSLVRVAQEFGQVKVVAPDRERSACGHSMTLYDPLRVKRVEWEGIEAYEVNGVPVDCVTVGFSVAWPDGCDLVLSGINHGPNVGWDVTYSGTVGGAMEGVIYGVRSISVSMAPVVDGAPLRLDTGERWLTENLGQLIAAQLPPDTFLNVNIPALDYADLRGAKVVELGKRIYEDRLAVREDPWGRPYYWQGGVATRNGETGTDVSACSEGCVAITPVSIDWTDHATVRALHEAGLCRTAVRR
jgi:5'-nucleotidase